jgi:hypothetical protein
LEGGIYNHRSFTDRPERNPYFSTTILKDAHDDRPVSEDTPQLIRVQEQSTGLNFRGVATATENVNDTLFGRVAMSYITGAHALKAGFQWGSGFQNQWQYNQDAPIQYRFNNGIPNRLTLFARDMYARFDMDADHGVFVQDRWTVDRLTVTGGLRYDYFHISIPETRIGPTLYAPNRNFVFPKADGVRWHNVSPRLGVAYDLFDTGKTAVKASVGRYLAGQLGMTSISAGTFTNLFAPANRIVSSTNRSWQDTNANFVPDCNLLNPAANGECGAMDNSAFGSAQPAVNYDPDLLRGWQKGEYNWQFSGGVQHEVLPRVSVDVAYFLTSFGNLLVRDDRAISPADYDQFSITAPRDPRLPGGGGYVVGPLLDLKPASFGRPADNIVRAADAYGKRIERWNGVDVNVTVRAWSNVLLQGGTSTGRRTSDDCEILAKLPEMNPMGLPYCHQQEKLLTQVKLFGSYTVPRIDVLVSATLQSLPTPIASGLFVSGIQAEYVATNAVVAPSLGRNLSGGARNVTVNLVEPATLYGERMTQVDVRLGKILTFGRTRTTLAVDIYNLLNSNTVLVVNNAYDSWQRPQSILQARFAKISVQFNF